MKAEQKSPEQIEAEKEAAFRSAFGGGQLQVDVMDESPISESVMRWGEARGYARPAGRGKHWATWRLTPAGRTAMHGNATL